MGRQNTRDYDNRSAQQRYEAPAPYQAQAAPYQAQAQFSGPVPLPDRRAGGQHVNEPQVQDVYIAVMGVTGAGKSTFISTCSGKKAKIGHSLQSCTTEVEDFWFMYNPSVRVHLVDTPGFDDTNLSDVQVLQNIAHWLSTSFKSGVRLNGIIFMHRISDPRLAGSAKRNLLMFKKLCGEKVYQSVVLATTMWGKVTPEEGDRREKELINEPTYWGSMYKLGSKVFRYHNTRESALDLVSYIISLHRSVTLDIQDEIVNKHREIDETSAAHQLNAEIIKERKKHQAALQDMQEQMAEAIAERDEVLQQEFKEEIDALQAKISKGDEEQLKLRQTLEEVDKRKEAEFKAFKEQMRRERQEEQRRFEAERAEFNSRFAVQEENMRKHQQREIERMAQEKANRDEMARKQEDYQRRAEERRVEQQRQMKEIEERYEKREQERLEEIARRRNRSFFDKLGDFLDDVFG